MSNRDYLLIGASVLCVVAGIFFVLHLWWPVRAGAQIRDFQTKRAHFI